MGRLNDGLIRGITVAAVALLALLPGAHAAKPQRRLKVGTVINGEQMATNSKDFRTTLHSRRLQDTTAIRSSIAFYITELAADLDAAGVDHTTISADAGGMPDGPTTDFITAKRPLKLAFFNRLDSSRSATQQAYIMEKLLPATGAMLARSMRVRTPSGPLVFDGIPDEEGVFLPAPSGGIDADVLLKVTSNPADSEECAAVVASASPLMHEYITARPLYGVIRLCRVDENNFYYDLTTIVHEILHALGFIGVMFPVFPGYPGGTGGPADFTTSRTIIKTPNVLTSARQQFACPSLEGAPFEDDGGSGTAGAHWEERIFQGEMLDAGDSGSVLHHNRHVLTDVSLALLQDTNWYDVKYGSAGFNSFGYKAGCEFVTGTYAGAMQDPAAARYLCSPQDAASEICLHDHSGEGRCLNAEAWDGFWHMYQFEENADCQGTGEGQRCLVQSSATGFSASGCVDMRCSGTGAVLIDGEPCDASSMDCPNEELMCGDPGLLTCVGAKLSDCSGNGDCLNGRCFCHSGWGGEDCSQSICVVSCPNGDPCPASGFCGVPECGEWSEGSDDRGVPCNGSTTPETANPSPPASIGSPAPAGSPAAVPPGGSAVGAAAAAAAAAAVFAAWLW